jgi:hypothetical protein
LETKHQPSVTHKENKREEDNYKAHVTRNPDRSPERQVDE